MTVNDIFAFLNSKFPVTDALDFDNVGILIGDPNTTVKKALIALDCTLETISFAIENNCNLIITHHPVIFDPLKNILEDSIPFNLIKNNISVISMHTNLDVGVNGINDCLCKVLGLENIVPVPSLDGYLLKGGKVLETDAKSFANALKTALGGSVKYVDNVKPITSILVCSGSGGNYVQDAIINGFDALVTADIKHHQFLEAKDKGICLFDAGHFNTEDIIVEPLKEMLQNEFINLEFLTFHSAAIKFE